MGDPVKISVLINNYNYADYLGAAIDSTLAQDHPNFEVVVVDDGSTDGSRDIIAGYGDRIIPVLKVNGGQASSFNAGFAASSGDLVMLLDSDDCLLPGKLVGFADLYAEHDLDWCFDRVTTDEDASAPARLDITLIDRRMDMAKGRFPSIPVPTSGLSFRRNLLSQILPMPTADDVVLSDNYLKFAAAYLGRGAVVETPMTFQRIHGQNRYTGSDQMQALKARIMTATGTALARRYPGLGVFGRRLAAGGLASSRLSGRALSMAISEIVAGSSSPGLDSLKLRALISLKRLRP
ncbi:hypothetical protein BH10PSE2_BH10PSE2_09860 [soil metagenome]